MLFAGHHCRHILLWSGDGFYVELLYQHLGYSGGEEAGEGRPEALGAIFLWGLLAALAISAPVGAGSPSAGSLGMPCATSSTSAPGRT